MSLLRPGTRLRQRAASAGRTLGGGAVWRYADSVTGLDADDGRTPAAAKQTIAGASAVLASGIGLRLAGGSDWGETLSVPYSGFRLGVHGTGDPPKIDGLSVATGWTVDGTYPNVWNKSYTLTGSQAQDYTRLFVDGVGATWYASKAALDAAADPNGWFSTNRTATTQTVSCYSTTDPNGNGKVYEFTERLNCVNGHSVTLSATRPAYVEGPLELRASRGQYGPGSFGRGEVRKVWLRWGGIHHTVTEAELMEDILLTDHDPAIAGNSAYTAYVENGAGRSHTARRVVLLATAQGPVGLFGHGGSATWDNSAGEGCYVEGAAYGDGINTTVSRAITDSCYKDVKIGVNGLVATAGVTVRRVAMKGVHTAAGVAAFASGTGGSSAAQTVLIEDCALYVSGGNATGFLRGSPAGSNYTLRRCVVYAHTDVVNFFAVNCPDGAVSLTMQDCIIFVNNARFVYGNFSSLTLSNNLYVGSATWSRVTTSPGNYGTLALWQAATGQDAGSAFSSSVAGLFSGDPSLGDFRLASTGLGATARAMGVGPAYHWDFNQRAVVAGPPEAWPTPPATEVERRAYISDPAAWDWYP